MNAEALVGTVLGTCTLQQLIGQGGMGAVYLAQQSRPRRQVAVKILLPAVQLKPGQQAAFLERFRRETDAAASLEHPNILPVHEYGERDGLAYLVMPYVSGGTLRDEMEREKPMPLQKVVNYLEQIAAALDFAHEHGVIHRDVKPANILMTADGRLLLTDFGLVKIVSEGEPAQTRLTAIGVLMGTPDYMAPEQVLGAEVDASTDIYSLGVILYQMVTGMIPFQGPMLMQVAMQHLHVPPPPPQALRQELPAAAGEVILRALAKRPTDRYKRTQELASAFRMALLNAGLNIANSSPFLSNPTEFRPVAPPLFRQAETKSSAARPSSGSFVPPSAQASIASPSFADLLPPTSTPLPSGMEMQQSVPTGNTPLPSTRLPIGRKMNLLRAPDNSNASSAPPPEASPPAMPMSPLTRSTAGDESATGNMSPLEGNALVPSDRANQVSLNPVSPPPGTMETLFPTGGLRQNDNRGGNTIKLTQSVKVVKVPVAGQPGRYVTGLLPTSNEQGAARPVASPSRLDVVETIKHLGKKHQRRVVLAAVALLMILPVLFGLVNSRIHQNAQTRLIRITPTPDMSATTTAQVSATVAANTILADPLQENIHNWPVSSTGSKLYVFKQGAYHITDEDAQDSATAILPDQVLPTSFVYALNVEEIKGDNTSVNNQFGMIFRFNSQQKNGRTITTFYIFEVSNSPGGEYQFWRYNDGSGSDPWTKLWSGSFGHEYHFGHGPTNQNVFRVIVTGSRFAFVVNGQRVGSAQDSSLSGSEIGMLVNMRGTEVAFSNLLLTYK